MSYKDLFTSIHALCYDCNNRDNCTIIDLYLFDERCIMILMGDIAYDMYASGSCFM